MPAERAREAITLGLRLARGIDEEAFYRRYPEGAPDVRAVADALCAEGWLVRDAGRLRLSRRGTLVANDVLCRFV